MVCKGYECKILYLADVLNNEDIEEAIFEESPDSFENDFDNFME